MFDIDNCPICNLSLIKDNYLFTCPTVPRHYEFRIYANVEKYDFGTHVLHRNLSKKRMLLYIDEDESRLNIEYLLPFDKLDTLDKVKKLICLI